MATASAVGAAAPAAHGGHGAFAAAAPAAAFDGKAAIALSQAAVGRTPRDAVFTTADGRRVRLSDFRGKPVVVSLIYTSCAHVCPATTRHLAKAVRAVRAALGDDSFTVLTIGFDSANDTPAAMERFARQQNARMAGWEFLSADRATIEQVAADLGFLFVESAKGFDHMAQATVLRADGSVYRQIYGVNFEMPMLGEPLKELVYDTPPNASLLSHLGNRVKLFCTVYDAAADRYVFDYSLFIGLAVGGLSLGSLGFLVGRELRRRPRG
ncbi:MAG TPA: SCO family protein [Burkholderiales bacterium]